MLPKTFVPLLTELNEFSRKKVRINIVGKDTAQSGELVQVLFPDGKYLPETFSISGLATTTTTAGFARLPAIEQCIEQVMFECGSVQLSPSLTYYSHIWGMLSDLQGSWNKKNYRAILNTQPTTSTVTANQTNVPFQLNNWLGFLNSIKILLTDRMPSFRLWFRLAQPNVLACGADGATQPTGAAFSFSNMYALVDTIKLSPVYDAMLDAKISQSPLQIPYTNYNVIPSQQGGLTNSHRFSSTSDALEKIHFWTIPTTWQSLNQIVDTDTYLSPAFNRGSPNLNNGFNVRFTLNGSSFPDVPLYQERGEILQQTLEALGNEHKDVTSQSHPNLTTLAKFGSKFFCSSISFTYEGDGEDAENRKCGLSALGNHLIGSVETVATAGQTDQVQPLIVLETKSVLEIGADRTVRVIY